MRAIDVANFFVDLSGKSDDNDLTKMKLIKLVYFAQALHLAKNKTPLFDEEIQAWCTSIGVDTSHDETVNRCAPKHYSYCAHCKTIERASM